MPSIRNDIRKFNRFELKYYLTFQAAKRFELAIAEYLDVDEYGDTEGKYAITSLYYDSPNNDFYWQKMEGIKFRRKLRIRHYESQQPLADDSKVFLEIKQRLDRVTQKRRMALPYADAVNLASAKIDDIRFTKLDKHLAQEILTMSLQYNLEPRSIVSYFRKAYVGSDYDLGLRVTFDTNLRYRISGLDLKSKIVGKSLFPADMVVMEIKANDRVPYWLSALVAEHNISLIRISKYCHSLEVAELEPHTKILTA